MSLLAVLAMSGAVDPDPDPSGIDPAELTVRRQVVPNTALQVGVFYPSADAAQTYELTHTLTSDATQLIASVDASKAGGRLSLTIGGVTHQALFSGVDSFTKATTSAPVFCDPIDVTVPAGTVITVRVFFEAVATQHSAAKALGHTPARWGAGDLTATGEGIANVNNSQRYLPTIVSLTGMTRPTTPAVLGIGDSIFESGSGNPTGYTRGVQAAGVAFLNAGRWAGSTIATGDVGLTGLPGFFTHVLDEYAFNDISSEAVTKVMADKLLTWDWVHSQNPDLQITACTITPNPNSTDGWTTLEGQTPNAGTTYGGLTRHERSVAYNEWIRDGAPIRSGVAAPGTTDPSAVRAGQAGHPLAGWLEIADTVESSRNSGIFRIDLGALTIDGAHMNDTAGSQIMVPIQAWAQGLTI